MTPGIWADVALHVFMMLIILGQCFMILYLLDDRIEQALATTKAATPGPWSILKGLKQNSFRRLSDTIVLRSASKEQESICCFYGHKTNDAAFVATMNPEFTAAVLEGWLLMEAELEQIKNEHGYAYNCSTQADKTLASARAKLGEKAHE